MTSQKPHNAERLNAVEAFCVWSGPELQAAFAHNAERWADALDLLAER